MKRLWACLLLTVVLGSELILSTAQGSCKQAGERLASACQQFRSAVAGFPELTSKDNVSIEVPINPIRIHNSYMQGTTDCQQHNEMYFCKCCFAYADFLAQSCRCNEESAPWLAKSGVSDDQLQSVTIAAAIACEKHGNIPLLDPQHGHACQQGIVQS